jgi:hypothetical protein
VQRVLIDAMLVHLLHLCSDRENTEDFIRCKKRNIHKHSVATVFEEKPLLPI